MPFITEELWGRIGAAREGDLILAPWPAYDPGLIDEKAAEEMGWVVALVSQVRAVRAEMNVPPAARIAIILNGAGAVSLARLQAHRGPIENLARLGSIAVEGGVPAGSAQLVLGEATLVLPLGEVIDIAAEQKRLAGEIAKLEGEIGRFDKKLSDERFLAKAPEEVVETQRERRAEATEARDHLDQALKRFAAV